MSGAIMLELPGTAPVLMTPELARLLQAALSRYRRTQPHSRDLAAEISRFLHERPSSSATEIARGVRARNTSVLTTLRDDPRFQRAPNVSERAWEHRLTVEQGRQGTYV